MHRTLVPGWLVATFAFGCGTPQDGNASPIDDGTSSAGAESTSDTSGTTMPADDDGTTTTAPADDDDDDEEDTNPPTTNDDDDDDSADETTTTTSAEESSSSTTGIDPVACAAYFGCAAACGDDPDCVEGCAEFTMVDVEACIAAKCEELFAECAEDQTSDACEEITQLCLPDDDTTSTGATETGTGTDSETGTGTETSAGSSTTTAAE